MRSCASFIHNGAEFISAQHVNHPGFGRRRQYRAEVDAHFITRLALFGRNQNNPIGSSGTINRRRRSVLQNGEVFNVVRVDETQGVGCARYTRVVEWHPVDHDQGIVVGVQRRAPTNPNPTTCTRSTTIGGDLYPGDFAVDQLFGGGDVAFDEVFFGNIGHRTRYIALFL